MLSRRTGLILGLALLGLSGCAGFAQEAGAGASLAGSLPAPGAKDVPVNVKLEWKPIAGAKGYDVYFAEKPLQEKFIVEPIFQCRVEKPQFILETLSAGRSYRWMAVPVPAASTPPDTSKNYQTFTTAPMASKEEIYAWSIRMADSIRGLYPTPAAVGEWNYTQGMVCDALISIAVRTGRDKDIDFAKAWADRFVTAEGKIAPFDEPLHSLDRMRPGPVLLWLYDRTKDEKYKKAAQYIAARLDDQPKTTDGGYWHRQTYPNQMWLDGIYMADVFSAEYAGMMKEPKYFDEACKQILLIAKHTHDEKTGLFFHGWDETKTRPWANKETGASPEFWARAIGWYGMAMADILEWLPADHPQRGEVMKIFKDYCASIIKYQDHDTGMWWQIMDKPTGPKNYVETSASIMFNYALAKGVQHEWIDASYLQNARRGFRGILNKEVDLLPSNRMDINGTVTVGSLGGNGGFYDYYVGVGTTKNDQKALGAMMYLTMVMSETANETGNGKLPRVGP